MYRRNIFRIITTILLSSLLTLSACGGGSNSDSSGNDTVNQTETKTGVFIDAPVQGLGYQTPSQQGITNQNGEFTYQAGEQISFFYNDIELGTVPAQELIPITLLSNSDNLPQVVQTLDTNPDPNKINISGITFPDELILQLENSMSGNNDLTVEELFDDQTLAELQAINNVTFVNQSLVSDTDAANHLLNQLEHLPWNESDFSKKLYITLNNSIIEAAAFLENGTGTLLGTYLSSGNPYAIDLSWVINADKTALMSPLNSSNNNAITFTKLSSLGNQVDYHFTNGETSDIGEWKQALPLSLTDLNGKHFLVDFGYPENTECSSMSMSFSNTNVTINEQCTSGFRSQNLNIENHDALDNTLFLHTTINNVFSSITLALVEGSPTAGAYIAMGFTEGQFDYANLISFTESNSPLQP